MKRFILTLITIVVGLPTAVFSQAATTTSTQFSRALAIPPILEATRSQSGEVVLNLTVQKGRTELIAGKATETLGYNGSYLGPTIRVRRGDTVRVNIENTLGEDTTVHWHGLHVPAEMDGGPHQIIRAGATWRPHFEISQEAATLWYHPHLLGKTAEHAYRGLAGLFIIDDKRSDGLGIPSNYGIDDIPIVLQDRRLDQNGQLYYRPTMHDVMSGLRGNTLLVNGVHQPFATVPAGMVRLRVLNGSNSSVYKVALGDQSAFHQIASDGGFLQHPIEMDDLVLSPGERAEVLVDFSRYKRGESVNLVTEIHQTGLFQTMQFRVGGPPAQALVLPARLNTIHRFDASDADRTRRFRLSSMGPGGRLTINGRNMNMRRIDEKVPLGATEIWELSNRGMGMMAQLPHSMHLHDVQFQVLSINGEQPPPQLMGWKDTVLIWPGETVRIMARFEDYTGIYMYHCHFLEHEDAGMMGQFEVVGD